MYDRLRIGSLWDAEEIAKEGWADKVVSLVAPGVELPKFNVPHHIIRCQDVEGLTDMGAPKYVDIAEALDFCDPDSKLLIHCEGGISRSTGLAVGALVKFGLDIPSACDYVHSQRVNMAPNYLILYHCEQYLQLDGLLVQQVQKVVSNYDKGLILWCADCKVHFKDGENCPGKHFIAPDEDVYV
jgi:predicted protein tyrosine phosphatase